jgi:hypothetical protein
MSKDTPSRRTDAFVVVKKGASDSGALKYHLPSGMPVKRVDADMLKRASAKSESAIRTAINNSRD